MRKPPPSHIEIAFESINVFADDGTMDLDELNHLLSIALRDGVIDDDERRVLANIFDRVTEGEIAPEVWEKMSEVRAKYRI